MPSPWKKHPLPDKAKVRGNAHLNRQLPANLKAQPLQIFASGARLGRIYRAAMKRHYLLIAGCILGAVSVGFNIHLYRQRHSPRSSEPAPRVSEVQQADAPVSPAGGTVQEVPGRPAETPFGKFDFSDTGFADGSWKLNGPDPAIKLDKPFDWEDVNPAKPKVDSDNLFGVGDPPKKPPVIKESYAGAQAGPPRNPNPSPPPPSK